MNRKKRNRRRLWLASSLLVLLIPAGIWFYVQRAVRQSVENELAELNLGSVTIGGVTTGSSGIVASDVRFYRDVDEPTDNGPNVKSPWITLEELTITKPLRQLIAGDREFDRMELSGLSVSIDVSDQSSSFDVATMNLANVELPAERISLRNAMITVTQPDRERLVVSNVDMDIESDSLAGAPTINVSGQITNFWRGDWQIAAAIQSKQNAVELHVASDLFSLPNKWTQFPTMPDNLNRYVNLTGSASLDVRLARPEVGRLDNTTTIVPKSLSLQLPTFDLEFALLHGQAVLHNGIVDFQEIVATSDQTDRVNVEGDLVINKFPIDLHFDATANQVSVATLRKLVPAIPLQVSGLANGVGSGRVQISQTLDTTLQLKADATSIEAAYGSIEAASSTTFVNIESLILDPSSNVLHLAGEVNVDAIAADQPIQRIMDTFEVHALQRQLDLDLMCQGQVRISIPLATADQIDTWELDVQAKADNGTVSGMSLQNIQVQTHLESGDLRFDDIVADVPRPPIDANNTDQSRIVVDVAWPLAPSSQHPATGRVNVNGTSLPAAWLTDLGEVQLNNLDFAHQHARAADVELTDFPDHVLGSINANATIQVNVAAPDDLAAWNVQANIYESQIGDEQVMLQSISGEAILADATIAINGVTGQIGADGNFTGSGSIDADTRQLVVAAVRSNDLPLSWIIDLVGRYVPTAEKFINQAGWITSGDKKNVDGRIKIDTTLRDGDSQGAVIEFASSSEDLAIREHRFKQFQLDGRITRDEIAISNTKLRLAMGGPLEAHGTIALDLPHDYHFHANIDDWLLNNFVVVSDILGYNFQVSDIHAGVTAKRPQISGLATGKIELDGTLAPFAWSSQGTTHVSQLSHSGQPLSDVSAEWSIDDRDWTNSVASAKLLGGRLELVEANSKPRRIRISIDDVKADEISVLAGTDFPKLTGLLHGDASFNQWDDIGKSWADLKLTGAATVIANVDVTNLGAEITYRSGKMTYDVKGNTLSGDLTGQGSTDNPMDDIRQISFPLEWKIEGAQLNRIALESHQYRYLKPLAGGLSAQLKTDLQPANSIEGLGRVRLSDLTWDNEFVTQLLVTDVRIANGMAELDQIRADLRRGQISGRARIPIDNTKTGTYQLDFRQFDLERMTAILMKDAVDAKGLFDARISGQIGQDINGYGTIGFQRASVLGISSDSSRIPVRFHFSPLSQSGHVEIQRSAFRVANGRVSGSAELDFGSSTDVDVDLRVVKLDTAKLFAGLNALGGGRGELSGRLRLHGHGIQRSRDLKGTFTGDLVRAEAFRLPLLNEIGNFLGAAQLRGRDFNSDKIDLRLANDVVEIRNLNLSNPLVQVAIEGRAFLDGRLDLSVAARIEKLNQPTLLEQIANSPLTRYSGNPIGFFAQAAEFLSNRVVFLKVTGTFDRPQIRVDAGQQIREETIRYFLRGSQILPNSETKNE